MTDERALFLALAAVYFAECWRWVPRGGIAVRSWFRGRFRVTQASAVLGNAAGGLVFLNPLPPFGTVFVCRAASLRERDVDRDGTVAGDDYGEEADDGTLERSTDLGAARQRLERFWRAARPLRLLNVGLFLLLFVGLPLGWKSRHAERLAVAAGACWLSILLVFHRAHARLMPRAVGDRWRLLSVMLFTPTAAIRSADALARDLLAGYHPLAAAAALCDRPAFAAFARAVLLDLRYPAGPAGPPEEVRNGLEAQRYRSRLLDRLEQLVVKVGIGPAGLTAPPAPSDPSHLSYCPRCDAQYVVAAGVCRDCGGRPLEPFDSPTATPGDPSRPTVSAAEG